MALRNGGSTAGFSTAGHARAQSAQRRGSLPLTTLTIIGHPDSSRVGDRLHLGELGAGREALLSRRQPPFTAPGALRGEPLGDKFLSRSPLRLEPLPDGGLRLHRDRSRTRVAIEGEPVTGSREILAAAVEAGVIVELAGRIVLLLHRRSVGAGEADAVGQPRRLIGDSEGMERLRGAIQRVAGLDVPVLLRGETGTGKELAARSLHERSPRRAGPFVAVNLGALSPALAAAELFGARKGAYTGADRDRPGYFGRADGGTLFLDEIGEAPLEIQVLLLRVLETGEVVPVGGQTPRSIDLRVVSATDADLDRAIAEGGFRAQLHHRLAGYTIHLPALRQRREDLGRLLVHFLHRELETVGEPPPANTPDAREPWLPASLVTRLARYSWPGNVRQLRNVARQLIIDSRGRPTLGEGVDLEQLLSAAPGEVAARAEAEATGKPAAEPKPKPKPKPPTTIPSRQRRKPADVSGDELIAALRDQRWNLKATAEALGVSRTSLYALLERSPEVRAATDVPPAEIRRAFELHAGDLNAMVSDLEISERALRQRLKDLGLRLPRPPTP